MAAGTWNITIEVGASFDETATFRRDGDLVDFTDATASARIVSADGATTLLDLTTENGRLVLGGAAGTLRVVLDDDATIALEDAVDGGAKWDAFVRFDAATVWKVWRGSVKLVPRISPAPAAVS